MKSHCDIYRSAAFLSRLRLWNLGAWNRASLLLIVMGTLLWGVPGCGKKAPCVDLSKPELEQCKANVDKLQAEINELKKTLAQAIASPGTIEVDPSVLTIGGKPIQVKPVEGNLAQEDVVRTMRENKGVLQACYERAMKKNTSLSQQKVTLNVAFSVQPTGESNDISISPNYDSGMISCMTKAIRRWKFPRFNGRPVGVQSPLTLTPRK